MAEHPLLRFLNKTDGPITKLATTSYQGVDTTFYYSLADLSPGICAGYRSRDVLEFCGAGWSRDRQESQEKAIVEGLERWAFKSLADSRASNAGLEYDSTSNGFAAVPKDLGEESAFRHSLAEAVERFALNCFWGARSLPIRPLDSDVLAPDVATLFDRFDGRLTHYQAVLTIPDDTAIPPALRLRPLQFVLSLFWRDKGGVLPGSACHQSVQVAVEKSALEAFNHLNAITRIENRQRCPSRTITDRRLMRFGTDACAADEVRIAIKQCLSRSREIRFPEIVFMNRLYGPWEPEVIVTRAVVGNSPPITEGDEFRFLI